MRAPGAVRGGGRRAAPGRAARGVDGPRAREKLDEAAFRRLHREILAAGPECPSWKGRRILAVDGSKIALPRELAAHGYRVADGARYPQGMVSVLYRPLDRIPVDLHLSAHGNERLAARTHLDRAAEGDVIVYDRGYRSFAMAIAHHERGLDFVFRIQENANPAFDAFIASGGTERTVTLDAPRDESSLRGRTLRVRLVRYVAGDTEFRLATSLHDGGRFDVRVLSDLYHGRWGIEEMYKTGKSVIEWFHAKSVRGVRQEPCAAFTLVTLTRQFSSRCDGDLNAGGGEDGLPEMRANFRNGPRLVGRGDRGPVPQTGRRGQAVRRADHDRAVALPPAGEARPQLPAKVHAAKEQVDPARRRLTSRTAPEKRPRLPAHARSAGPFLSERSESLSECHWAAVSEVRGH